MEITKKTPYFEIEENILKRNVEVLEGAINKYWNNTIVGYSFKTNSLKAICDFMRNKGYFAEVVSEDEFNLAKSLGFRAQNIIYNGPCKSKDTVFELIENNGIINLDTQREVDWVIEYAKNTNKEVKVGLRVNFDLERLCPNETAMGEIGSRFGYTYENGDLEKVINRLKQENIKVEGLHLHNSSRTRSIKIYDVLSKKACEIAKNLQLNLAYIDIGGGFFGGVPGERDFYDYFEVISNNLSETFDKSLTLIVEPGASLVASAINYVSSVIDIKDNPMGNRVVLIDGSRIHIDPLMTKTNYDYNLISDSKEIKNNQLICGFTCMEHDILMQIKNEIELKVGDQIKYNKVGSYTLTLSPLFIEYFPVVYWRKSNGEETIVRYKWDEHQLVAKQEVVK